MCDQYEHKLTNFSFETEFVGFTRFLSHSVSLRLTPYCICPLFQAINGTKGTFYHVPFVLAIDCSWAMKGHDGLFSCQRVMTMIVHLHRACMLFFTMIELHLLASHADCYMCIIYICSPRQKLLVKIQKSIRGEKWPIRTGSPD